MRLRRRRVGVAWSQQQRVEKVRLKDIWGPGVDLLGSSNLNIFKNTFQKQSTFLKCRLIFKPLTINCGKLNISFWTKS